MFTLFDAYRPRSRISHREAFGQGPMRNFTTGLTFSLNESIMQLSQIGGGDVHVDGLI